MFAKIKQFFDRGAKVKLRGRAKAHIIGLDGTIRDETDFGNNLITEEGLAAMVRRAGGISQDAFTYLAVGTDSTAESAAHTALISEITTSGLERTAATVSVVTTTVTDDTLRLFVEFTATGTVTVEEIGALSAASAGTLLGRKLTGTKALVSGEKLAGTYEFQFE